MFEWISDCCVCPNCKASLRPQKLVRRVGKILGGSLLCNGCQAIYRIISGIPVLLPPGEKCRSWCFPTQDIVTDPESFVTRSPRDRPPMYEVLTYFGKERVLEAIQQGTRLPPKRRKDLPDFDGPISPQEKRRAYRPTQPDSVQNMIEVMRKKWNENPLFLELASFILGLDSDNILDFGTGPGGLLYRLLSDSKHTQIIGLEYSFTNARMTQAGIERLNQASRAGMVEADARSMPFSTAYFDCVTSLYGSYHIPKYHLAIQEAYRILKPGGWYLETFYTNYPSYTKGLMTRKEEELLLKYVQLPVDVEDVESVCKNAGFKQIEKVSSEDSCLIKAQKPRACETLTWSISANQGWTTVNPQTGNGH